MSKFITGFVLQITKTKETDAVVRLFTKEHGIQAAYFKGLYGSKSSRRQIVELLNELEVSLPGNKATNLPTAAQCELKSTCLGLKDQSHGYSEAFLLAEVLLHMLPEADEQPEFYALIQQVQQLDPKEAAKNLCLLLPMILVSLGFLGDISYDVHTQEKLDPAQQIFPALSQPGFMQVGSKKIHAQENWQTDDQLYDSEQDQNSLNSENGENQQTFVTIIKAWQFAVTSGDLVTASKLDLPPYAIKRALSLLCQWIELTTSKQLKSKEMLLQYLNLIPN